MRQNGGIAGNAMDGAMIGWDRKRYAKYCTALYERAQSGRYAALGVDYYKLARQEMDRDWTLKHYVQECVLDHGDPVRRLSDDIRLHGQMQSIASVL
jgi:hypothetical protein